MREHTQACTCVNTHAPACTPTQAHSHTHAYRFANQWVVEITVILQPPQGGWFSEVPPSPELLIFALLTDSCNNHADISSSFPSFKELGFFFPVEVGLWNKRSKRLLLHLCGVKKASYGVSWRVWNWHLLSHPGGQRASFWRDFSQSLDKYQENEGLWPRVVTSLKVVCVSYSDTQQEVFNFLTLCQALW